MANPDTGNLATVTLSGFTARVISIKLPKLEVGDIKLEHLGMTDFQEYEPGDLIEPDMCEMVYEFDSALTPPIIGLVGTLTVTFPVPPALTNGATFSGTGYRKANQFPELKNGELQKGTLTFKFNGKTGPAFAEAT